MWSELMMVSCFSLVIPLSTLSCWSGLTLGNLWVFVDSFSALRILRTYGQQGKRLGTRWCVSCSTSGLLTRIGTSSSSSFSIKLSPRSPRQATVLMCGQTVHTLARS
jgi:hypothetical protein